jgi:hypothetical protein
MVVRLRLKRDGTRAETRIRLSAKRTSPFKSAGASVQSTTGSGGVRISVTNAGYTTFRGSVKSTDYPLHSPGSPSLLLPCVTVCHQVSNALYVVVTLLPLKKRRFYALTSMTALHSKLYLPKIKYLTSFTANFILVNDRLDALFLNVFISCIYMFRATSAHHQEDQIVSIHRLV